MAAKYVDNVSAGPAPEVEELAATLALLYLDTDELGAGGGADLAGGSASSAGPGGLALAPGHTQLGVACAVPATPAAPALPATPAETALSTDLIFMRVCDYAAPRSIVSLSRTCRQLTALTRLYADRAYGDFPVPVLAKAGRQDVLTARWRRLGCPQDEFDSALVAAGQSGRAATARWLLTTTFGPCAGGKPVVPGRSAVDAAFLSLVENGMMCEPLEWFLNKCLAPPSRTTTEAAFVTACGCGKLGLAQVLYSHLAAKGLDSPQQEALLARALVATGGMVCHNHVVAWVVACQRRLQDRYF
jgi:hypothetical protein